MRKTLIVASSEFGTLVRSKAFMISVLLMPVVMTVSVIVVRATRDSADTKDRTFAVVDYTGVLGGKLTLLAGELNRRGAAAPAEDGTVVGAKFLPVLVPPAGRDANQLRGELSDRVRRGELFAFVELPAGLLDPASGARIRYYSDHPSYAALPEWVRTSVNALILTERFRTSAVDSALVVRLLRQAPVETLGLFARDAEGTLQAAQHVDQFREVGVPTVLMALMYLTVMASSPQLLNTVIEEKMSRISEILIASVTPFQLMMGKLIGSAGVSLVLAVVYIAGGLIVANYWGYADAVSPAILGWFLVYLTMAVFLFGSIFIAIGAACTDLKDSQNMMTPVMLLVMLPVVTSRVVLRAPDGVMATVLSMIPTATPFLMLLRISLQPGPPAWEIALSLLLTAATVAVTVWAAGKIFRTGLLMQGKSATIPEMFRWVRAR